VDFAAHALAQRGVDHAMASQRQLAAERVAHDGCLEMYPIRTLDLHARAGQALFDQLADEFGIHEA